MIGWYEEMSEEGMLCPNCWGRGKVPPFLYPGYRGYDYIGREEPCLLCGGFGRVFEQNIDIGKLLTRITDSSSEAKDFDRLMRRFNGKYYREWRAENLFDLAMYHKWFTDKLVDAIKLGEGKTNDWK